MEPNINCVDPVTGTLRHNTQRRARYLVLTINWSTLERKGNTQEKSQQHSRERATLKRNVNNTREKGQHRATLSQQEKRKWYSLSLEIA